MSFPGRTEYMLRMRFETRTTRRIRVGRSSQRVNEGDHRAIVAYSHRVQAEVSLSAGGVIHGGVPVHAGCRRRANVRGVTVAARENQVAPCVI